MTNQDFNAAFKAGKTKVLYSDIDGSVYELTIVKVGPKEVTLFSSFLNEKRKLSFKRIFEYPQYSLMVAGIESVCSCLKGKGIDYDENGKAYCIDCEKYLEQIIL